MKITEVMKASKFNIVGGSSFLWKCYGDNAYMIDYASEKSNVEISCIFDKINETVHEIFIAQDTDSCRWIDPKYEESRKKEYEKRGILFDIIETSSNEISVMITKIETEKDILKKIKKIMK